MSWRRGELWLDGDLIWFREPAAVTAVAGFAPAIAGSAAPPGLVASRLRRAEWRRRRNARRILLTLLALSPALLFPLVPPRYAGGGAEPVAEDVSALQPTVAAAAAVTPAAVQAIARAMRDTAPASAQAADPAPAIDWNRATSVGVPYGGSLVAGTQLPVEAPNWVTWNPLTDSVPNAPKRLYGNERTIRAIVAVTAAYRAAHPAAPRVVIGDISREHGGPMLDAHVSHQNGLDVDVYYPRLDGLLREPRTPDSIDRRLAQELVDRFVAAGAQIIFVGHSTGLRGPAGVVVPYANHDNHMHVRFPPPGS
jgi:murein endopeptidase